MLPQGDQGPGGLSTLSKGELLATSVVPAFDSSLAGASNSWGSFSCMSQITVSHSTRHDLPWLIHF